VENDARRAITSLAVGIHYLILIVLHNGIRTILHHLKETTTDLCLKFAQQLPAFMAMCRTTY
jgi:hypothetical protein